MTYRADVLTAVFVDGTVERPHAVAAGSWRRMSTLSRRVAKAVSCVLERVPDLDRTSLPVIYGTAWGETVPSGAVLQRLFLEGPRMVSPTAFQGSVYNATIGHSSVALGLEGPSETVCAGMATGLSTLFRGVENLARHERVLVVVADCLNDASCAAMRGVGPASEGVVALLLGRGRALTLGDGLPDQVHATRALRLPYETAFQPVSADRRPEEARGLNTTNGVVCLLQHGSVVEQDDGIFLHATLDPPVLPDLVPSG